MKSRRAYALPPASESALASMSIFMLKFLKLIFSKPYDGLASFLVQ